MTMRSLAVSDSTSPVHSAMMQPVVVVVIARFILGMGTKVALLVEAADSSVLKDTLSGVQAPATAAAGVTSRAVRSFCARCPDAGKAHARIDAAVETNNSGVFFIIFS